MEAQTSTSRKLTKAFGNMPFNLRRGTLAKKALKFKSTRGHGQFIDERDRQWTLRAYYVLKMSDHFIDKDDEAVVDLVREVSGCNLDSISSIIESDTFAVKDNRGHDLRRVLTPEVEEEAKDLVVRTLRNELEAGIPVSSKDVRAWLREQKNISMSKSTLLKYLKNWSINWRRLQFQEYRKTREAVLIQREEFLQKVKDELGDCKHVRACKCPAQRKLVFIDESYIHEHHVSGFGLTIDNMPLQKPSGKGKRAVIAAALTEDGWLGMNIRQQFQSDVNGLYENGSIRYWAANVGGDYHQNFNGEVFERYFEECVLENLQEPSLIILDRASYHLTCPDDVP